MPRPGIFSSCNLGRPVKKPYHCALFYQPKWPKLALGAQRAGCEGLLLEVYMLTISLLVGSVTGTARAAAAAMAARISEQGINPVIIDDGGMPQEKGPWLICTSTTGSGDIPENIWPFYQRLNQGLYLPEQAFAVLALGDSAYPNFAQAGRDIYNTLIDCAAIPLADIYCIDAIYENNPTACAVEWLETWINKLHA
jgi:MioC protein